MSIEGRYGNGEVRVNANPFAKETNAKEAFIELKGGKKALVVFVTVLSAIAGLGLFSAFTATLAFRAIVKRLDDPLANKTNKVGKETLKIETNNTENNVVKVDGKKTENSELEQEEDLEIPEKEDNNEKLVLNEKDDEELVLSEEGDEEFVLSEEDSGEFVTFDLDKDKEINFDDKEKKEVDQNIENPLKELKVQESTRLENEILARKNPSVKDILAGKFDGMGIKTESFEHDGKKYDGIMYETSFVCGASKAGKSTFAKVLGNSEYEPPEISLFSTTKESTNITSMKGVEIKDKESKVKNYLRVKNCIDTPGLQEIKGKSEQADQRKNDEIMNTAIFGKDFIKNQVSVIPHFYLTFSFASGIKSEDFNAMKALLPVLKKNGVDKSAVKFLITRCEGLDLIDREGGVRKDGEKVKGLKDELIWSPQFQEVLYLLMEVDPKDLNETEKKEIVAKAKVFFIGAINPDNLEDAKGWDKENVKEMKKVILDDMEQPLNELAKNQELIVIEPLEVN